jgi:hypothetical protein
MDSGDIAQLAIILGYMLTKSTIITLEAIRGPVYMSCPPLNDSGLQSHLVQTYWYPLEYAALHKHDVAIAPVLYNRTSLIQDFAV